MGIWKERVMMPEGEKGDGRVRFRVGDGRYVRHLQVIVCTCRQSCELAGTLMYCEGKGLHGYLHVPWPYGSLTFICVRG